MSKSLGRVKAALQAAGIDAAQVEARGEIRTAEAAAAEAGVAVDQIVKSILFQGISGRLFLFLTAGGNRVDPAKAAALAGEDLSRAEVDIVRAVTGFAIGGVAPLGHLPPRPPSSIPGFSTLTRSGPPQVPRATCSEPRPRTWCGPQVRLSQTSPDKRKTAHHGPM